MAARGRASWSSGWSAPPRRRRSAAQRLLEQLKEHRTRDWRGVLTRGLHGDMQRSGLHLPVKVPRHGVSRCARSVFLRARRPIRDNFIHTPYRIDKLWKLGHTPVFPLHSLYLWLVVHGCVQFFPRAVPTPTLVSAAAHTRPGRASSKPPRPVLVGMCSDNH